MSTESRESAGPIEDLQHAEPPPAPPPPQRIEPDATPTGESALARAARAEIAALASGQETPSTPGVPATLVEQPTPSAQVTQLPLSAAPLVGRSFFRWVWIGMLRYSYRLWTRIATRLFPENSRRATLAMSLGVPLPDRLNLSWVTPQLAVGGRIRPADIARLRKVGVTAVVDTRAEHKDDEAALAKQGIKLLYLPTPDTYPLSIEDLRHGSEWINEQINEGGRVLVHCEHGVGRSVLLTTAAIVASGLGAQESLDLVQRKRWQAAPNRRQMERLQAFERSLRETPQA